MKAFINTKMYGMAVVYNISLAEPVPFQMVNHGSIMVDDYVVDHGLANPPPPGH